MTDISVKYNTGFKRFVAAVIDSFVLLPLVFVDNHFRFTFDSKIAIFIWLFLLTGVTIFYSVFLHYKFWQTIGKMVTGVKVVTFDETKNITIKQALLRDGFFIVAETIGLIYFVVQLAKTIVPTTELLDEFDNFGSTVSGIWVLLELVSMMMNKKRRAIHDFIAGSVVIRTEYSKEKMQSN